MLFWGVIFSFVIVVVIITIAITICFLLLLWFALTENVKTFCLIKWYVFKTAAIKSELTFFKAKAGPHITVSTPKQKKNLARQIHFSLNAVKMFCFVMCCAGLFFFLLLLLISFHLQSFNSHCSTHKCIHYTINKFVIVSIPLT